jgi:ribosomal protein S18 acetylase RimI-like enzyme
VSESAAVVREAVPADAPQIVLLINRAFQVERFFKNADRTNLEQVQQMMQDGTFLLLVDRNEIAACIFVKLTGDRAYLGTLAVDPGRQRSGVGTRTMQEAENYCRVAGCTALDIRIVNVRTELPAIYRKFGFVETGTESAEMIKAATQPVHFVTMSKPL